MEQEYVFKKLRRGDIITTSFDDGKAFVIGEVYRGTGHTWGQVKVHVLYAEEVGFPWGPKTGSTYSFSASSVRKLLVKKIRTKKPKVIPCESDSCPIKI